MTAIRCVFACAGLLGVLLLAACAAPAQPSPMAAAPALPISYGEIISIRPVAMPAGGAALPPNLLGALGSSQAATSVATARIEFIVRLDSSAQPVSIVQANPDDLRPGERVALTYGEHVHIARAGT